MLTRIFRGLCRQKSGPPESRSRFHPGGGDKACARHRRQKTAGMLLFTAALERYAGAQVKLYVKIGPKQESGARKSWHGVRTS
jgi:hypothetical protein